MWENLKAGIASVIRTNNNNEITGANLQSVLNNIVNTVGANATFAGMATPNTNPGSPDGPVFYFTQGPGLYVNFGNLQIDDNIVILANLTGVWQNLGPLVYESFTPADKSKLDSIESGAEVNVQSDWNQTDDSEDDYIKNKPSVYTKTEIDQMLAGNVKREIVSELPQTGVDGTIYMVPSATATTGDVYDEYMWLSTQGQVSAHFEKIGTTKADLANYYTKTEVDTALGNKQASITITNDTTDPADNDTVIMQASGTTNTTSFLRRTMSKIWDYIKSKADGVYWSHKWLNVNVYGSPKVFYDIHTTDMLYAAHLRYTVTWKTYDESTNELILDKEDQISRLFNGQPENQQGATPVYGQYDLIEIEDQNKFLNKGVNSLYVCFYTSFPSEAPTVISYSATDVATNVTAIKINNYYYRYDVSGTAKKISIKVKGNQENPTWICGVSEIIMSNQRCSLERESAVTKHAVPQNLYGEVIAPKFTMRGGTNKQVLLANGTVATLPLSIANGGTGATTAANAEYNLITKLRATRLTTLIDDNKRIPFCNENPIPNDGVFAGYRYASQLWDYIKGKADNVYTQKGDSYTVNMSADANHQGTNEYRVLATLATADCCVLNITKTIYGYPAQNTVWFANQNAMSLISLSDFGFVAIGGRSGQSADLCVPVLPTGHPAVEYKIQIVRSTDSESVTFPSSATYKTYSRPMKANVVMRDEISTDAVTFNITGGTGSVSLEDSNDFIGNVTDASTSAGITVTNYEQGQCYRFTFTEELEGVTLYSSNSVALCTVNETIQKGDVLTFTSVSNTAGGWMYSKTGASIKSSDGSVGIEWEDGVADLSVPVTPPNVVLNRSELDWEDDRTLSIGQGAQAQSYSGDESNPYAYTEIGELSQFKVDGGSNEYYHAVTAGTTYSINRSGTVVSYTPSVSGYVIICSLSGFSSTRHDFSDDNHKWTVKTGSTTVSSVIRDAVISGSNKYIIGVITASSSSISQFSAQSTVRYWTKHNTIQAMNIAICAFATGKNTIAIGNSSYGSNSITIGKNGAEAHTECIAIGYSAKALAVNAVVIGPSAEVSGKWSLAIGSNAKVPFSNYSLAIGTSARANAGWSVVIGSNSTSAESNAVVIGSDATANGSNNIVIGRNAKVGKTTGDNTYPQYRAKRFNAVSFTEGGNSKYYMFCQSSNNETATITVGSTTVTLTPPNNNVNFFIVINDSSAPLIYRTIGPYAKVNGVNTYITNMDSRNIEITPISGNYYALWLYGYETNFPQSVSAFSILSFIKASGYGFPIDSYAIGYEATSLYSCGIAIGREAVCTKDSQIIIGNYGIPDEDAMLIIGNGVAGNVRKNILIIDSNELMHVRGIINAVRTIDTGGTMASVTQLKDGVLKVTGGGQLELSTTGAVEGLAVKVYASGSQLICNGNTINANCFKEYIFLDGDWRAQM